MDFLGLKTLDVIKHTEELIRHRGGGYADFSTETISEAGTPEAEGTFKMLGEGKSFEVFQFESDGMQNILKQAKPGKIEDLIALNALYRPGPMDNISQFVESKIGRRAISYPDPSLENVLKETYGVIVYQEQVMQVAQIIAGYTLGGADMLRRAMGKKKKEILDKEKIPFLKGAAEQGYSEETASRIYDILVPFAGYGFNKSHAAAYSVVAYHTAYLKANFPAEFMAANLTNEIHSTDKDKLSECIGEARKMGLSIDPPDINRSDKYFTVVDGRIVYGFLGIKGLGEGPSEEIIRCRAKDPYRDFMDFLSRVDIKAVGKSVIERLILTGAFDSFGISRETLKGNLEKAVEYAQGIKDEKKFGQVSLFGDTGEKEYPDFEFEEFPDLSRSERLKNEKDLIGFYFSGHPMDEYRELWRQTVKADLSKPESLAAGSCILVGIIKTVKTIVSAKGGKMAFGTLEDYNGEIELTFFPKVWEKCEAKVETGSVAVLKGKIEYQQDKDRYSFVADEYLSPEDAETILKQDEAQNRKWDRYRNIRRYAKDLDLRILDLAAPAKAEAGTYTVVGTLKSLRPHRDKNGKEMAFGTLQDDRGEIDLLFFSRAWENCKALAVVDEVLALKGAIDPAKDKNPEKPSFTVTSVQDLSRLVRAAAKKADADDSSKAEEDAKKEKAEKESAEKEEARYRELHIRLLSEAAEKEEALLPLLDYVRLNPGPCSLLIHVPVFQGSSENGRMRETVIRTAMGISGSASLGDLSRCAAVAEAWGA
ncbi:MAG: DNA polymerase III subunit alpha, partial [Treponema sp.]|jgi:DNA polymerase-3 subunit alpha|nr:DNA polymerase III subunit alpha [Treponema sp.]